MEPAIFEREPNCPVTFNGITFQPMDIKALVTTVYDDSNISTVFTGARYNGYNDSIDEYGSHTDESYRDLNPDAGTEVWNQPVVGFKVYEQTAMTLEKAAQTFYGLPDYPWNNASKSIVYTKSRLSWINETYTDGGLVASGLNENFTVGADYDYLLELDENEEIIGGEWLYGSHDNHPDFLWLLKEKPAFDTAISIGLSYANVTMLLEKAVDCFDAPLTVRLNTHKAT
ncbi:Protocadherin Fat protein [Phytophthora nicotianae]|uniref:Protocadherin Fat protein n=1 Tax=Phytophthora nicotianae TaxID=4792 RepID=A0A0W8D593_PHYNI|nr:Protocadherin Fat protein [Phytophthora nicotianae]